MPLFDYSSVDITISIGVTALYAILLWWSLLIPIIVSLRFSNVTPLPCVAERWGCTASEECGKKEKHEGRISLHLFVYPLRRSTRYRAASSPAIAKTDVKPGTPFLGSLCVGAEVFTSTGVLTTSSVETQTGSPSIMRKREYHSGTSINRTAVLGDQYRKGLADVDGSWKIPSIPCFDRYRLCACTR